MKKVRVLGLIMTLLLFTFMGCSNSDDDVVSTGLKNGDVVTFTILQTTDMHDHASGTGASATYSPADGVDSSASTTGQDLTKGGYARIATVINNVMAQKENVLLVDSGDYTMGTVYDMTASDPLAFKFFETMQYDAVTIGNHEFDWSSLGLAMLITNALGSSGNGFTVPIIATNMQTDGVTGTDDDGIESLIQSGVIEKSTIITLANGLKVGIIGLMGQTADLYAPAAPPVTFNHSTAYIQGQIDSLRSAGANVILALSHSGILDPNGTPYGDDIDLATAVTGLDIIASGHEHEETNNVVKESNVYIFCAGHYGQNLAQLDVTVTIGTGVTSATLTNHAIDDSTPGDSLINTMVDGYNASIDQALSAVMTGLTVNGIVAYASTDNVEQPQAAAESGMGNMVADAMRYTLQPFVSAGSITGPTLAVAANGVIRNGFDNGQNVSFADLYAVLPLGMTLDATQQNVPGYPLHLIYLTGAEVKNICQVSAYVMASQDKTFMSTIQTTIPLLYTALSQLNPEYFMSLSGVQYTHSGITGGYAVTSVNMYDATDYQCQNPSTAVSDSTYYACVVDLYTLLVLQQSQMQALLTALNIPIQPKYAPDASALITSSNMMDSRIDAQPDALGGAPGIQEVKGWQSLLNYVTAQGANGGLESVIPDTAYGTSAITSGDSSRINP